MVEAGYAGKKGLIRFPTVFSMTIFTASCLGVVNLYTQRPEKIGYMP
jgi:hypothetical protein